MAGRHLRGPRSRCRIALTRRTPRSPGLRQAGTPPGALGGRGYALSLAGLAVHWGGCSGIQLRDLQHCRASDAFRLMSQRALHLHALRGNPTPKSVTRHSAATCT